MASEVDMKHAVLPAVRRLTEGLDLSREEAKAAFDTVIRDDLDSYYFFALTLAMHTKQETVPELLGLCDSLRDITPELPLSDPIPGNAIDVSGTGGDRIKTFNVSTAVSVVVASAGVSVAKQAFFAVTGFSGSADLLARLGVNVAAISAEPAGVVSLFKQTGLVAYHLLLHPLPGCRGLTSWVAKRQEIALNFITPLHVVAFAYSPFPIKTRLYGVYDPRYLKPLAEVFLGLGYTRGMVVHGNAGLDEISVVGETEICEFERNEVKTYTIGPGDLGLPTASVSEIMATSAEENTADFLRVIYGADSGPKTDMVLANAGAALYLAGQATGLEDGVQAAAKLVKDGVAAGKLEEFVSACGDMTVLEKLKLDHLP